ncbi:hypothetical protein FF125_14335 [Aureibaculum algae]|uniref:Uncharacterized protein n=1 Tax=Aureibaculum algae TaxID=2584122 RepID=A0A5B7TT55_9FLAO|nr:hypothetical protein [Aureibaculum algae]QCX39560.1 hypothetical protein FF125_14335 [Aureibaculum algae]
MKLVIKCKDCREENKVPNYARDRVNYAKKFGDKFELNCKKCNKTNEYHVDDIRAENYRLGEIITNRIIVLVIVSVISIILMIAFWGSPISWSFILLPIATLFFFKNNDSKKQLNFNKHKMKGRIPTSGLKR